MRGTGVVSCVVPVHNGARFVAAALQSILDQTYQPLEVIAVDDGSTDDTRAVVERFGPAVRYLHQANAGPAVARNNGLRAVTGEYVAFLDADDLWLPEKISRQIAVLTTYSGLGFVVTMVQNFWEEELEIERLAFRDHPRAKPIPGYVTGTLLARRSAFALIGGFDEALGHGDSADWFLRAREAEVQGSLLPEALLLRRLHRENRSRAQAARSRDEFLLLLKKSLDRRRSGGAGQ